MNTSAENLDKIFNIFYDLVSQNEFNRDVESVLSILDSKNDMSDDEEILDTNGDTVDVSMAKIKAVQDDINDYLKCGSEQLLQKRNWMYYIFLTNYVFSKYNPAANEDFKVKYEFLNKIYNDYSSHQILSILYGHPQLLRDLIEQYNIIEYEFNTEFQDKKEDFEQIVLFYAEQTPPPDDYEIVLLPQIYQNIVMDIDLMHRIEQLPIEDTVTNIFDYVMNTPEELPNILNVPLETIQRNTSIFKDELTLYTYIYLSCKTQSLGLSLNEQSLFEYIYDYLNGTEHAFAINGDSQYMIKQYLHVLQNKDLLLKKFPREIDEALKLARKKEKINALSITCFKH